MTRDGTLRRTRVAYALCALVLGGVVVAACSSGAHDSSEPDSADIAASQAQEASLSSSRALAQSVSGANALCSQWFNSVVPMVNGYNQFMTKLNQAQEYDKLGGADASALGQFESGETAIRAKLDAQVPQQVQDEVNNFLAKSAALAAGIKDKDRFRLAKPAAEWTDSRHRVATVCGAFVTPTGTVSTMPSLPALPPIASAAPVSGSPGSAAPSGSSAVTTTAAAPSS